MMEKEYIEKNELLDILDKDVKWQRSFGFYDVAAHTRRIYEKISCLPSANAISTDDLVEIFSKIEQLIHENTRPKWFGDVFMDIEYDMKSIKAGIKKLRTEYIEE